MVFSCIDIGGTNTVIGVGNDEFSIVEKTDSDTFLQDIRSSLEDILADTGHGLDEMKSIAFAAAGPIDRERGTFHPPNLPVDTVQLRAPFKDTGADIHILNDCNSAVLGEYVYGEDSAEDLVYLTISTGIGAGIMVDGSLVEGSKGNFGEVGHIAVDTKGHRCGCGGTDHWEAYCSGANLPDMAEHLFGYSFSDARELFDAFYAGDARAEKVVAEMQTYNARGIANLVNIFDPDVIAMGGGVALNHHSIIVDGLQDRIREESVNGVPEIRLCSLREKAVIHGLRSICNGHDPR